MEPLSADEVRSRFVSFFEGKGHEKIASSPVVPHDDATLLFCNAGMNQFKSIFTGEVDDSSEMGKLRRAVNSQKCIRAGGKHNDLDDVGKDVYHHTFFEMLGNWSFGSYFKEEACAMAWELLTVVYKIPENRLYVTYFGGDSSLPTITSDEECKKIWMALGVPEERIVSADAKDNFWEMGEVGPCGPCTEIHYDRIGGRNAADLVNKDDPDVLEIWNLVFMQFFRNADRSVSGLDKKSIDTGMGLERLVSVIQNKRSNYDTDIFAGIFDEIQIVTGAEAYQGKVSTDIESASIDEVDKLKLEIHRDVAYRVIADHVRCLSIAIADGAAPSSDGRGSVLRSVLRRAVRFGRVHLSAPTEKPWFFRMVQPVVESLGEAFPGLKAAQSEIESMLADEERQFVKTLDRGEKLFRKGIDKIRAAGGSQVPGELIFVLFTRCGFPVDLIKLMADEAGLTCDMVGYDESFVSHQRASENAEFKNKNRFLFRPDHADDLRSLGYSCTDDAPKYDWISVESDGCSTVSKVVAIFQQTTMKLLDVAPPEELVAVVLDKTNFYAEAGGQISDVGILEFAEGEFEVEDVRSAGRFLLHIGSSTSELHVGAEIVAKPDYTTRSSTAKNHTGTHLINFALRSILESDCDQKGSLVNDEKLRFDFEYGKAMSTDQVAALESKVADIVEMNQAVFAENRSLAEAKGIRGLRAVAGDDYPDPVRVVSVGVSASDSIGDDKENNTSIEFCGGTHCVKTGEVGSLAVITEEAVSKGVRRLVAVTGKAASDVRSFSKEIEAMATSAGSPSDVVTLKTILKEKKERLTLLSRKRIVDMVSALDVQFKEKAKQRTKELVKVGESSGEALSQSTPTGSGAIVVNMPELEGEFKGLEAVTKAMASSHKETPLLVISMAKSGSVSCLAICPKENKFGANAWVGAALAAVGGKAGGKADVARGVIKDGTRDIVQDMEAAAKKFIEKN